MFNEGTMYQLIWKTELVEAGIKLRGRTFLVLVVMIGMFIEKLSLSLYMIWF